MTLDMLLYCLELRRDLLISEDEIWWSSLGPDKRMARALRKHRRGLRLLMQLSDISTCPARDLHRASWYYSGAGRFTCHDCERITFLEQEQEA